MTLPLFSQVQLTQDLPQFNLKKGSRGIIVEHYSLPEGEEDGYSLEGLIAQDTVEVAESQIRLISLKQKNENAVLISPQNAQV